MPTMKPTMHSEMMAMVDEAVHIRAREASIRSRTDTDSLAFEAASESCE